MNKLILLILLVSIDINAGTIKPCESWNSMCKNVPEIVATKCRLGVPVYKNQCSALGINANLYALNHSLVEGMPVSTLQGNSTNKLLLGFGIVVKQ